MGVLLRLYVDALMKGNPVVVFLTMVAAVAVSVGPFYEGISKRDPTAIGLMIGILVMIVILLSVVIIDRKNNPDNKKKRPASKSGRR